MRGGQRLALVTERDHVPVRHGRRAGATRTGSPGPLGVVRGLFLLGIDARGLAVSIAVTTPARHAGSHVVRMRGLGHRNTMSAFSDKSRPSRRSML